MKTQKKSRGERSGAAALTAATRPKGFISVRRNLSGAECALYDELRWSVPMIDAAVRKIVRLIGGFKITSRSKAVENELNDFLAHIKVGCSGQGIDCFISEYADSLLTYGTAVGEIVVDGRTGGIYGLYNADIKELELSESESGMGVKLRTRGSNTEIDRPDLITVSALNPNSSCPLGNSLLSGLPFVSGVLMKIYECIGTNFDRLGNLRFSVTYDPKDGGMDGAFASDRAAEIAREWSAAMSDSSSVKDFVAVGDVKIKVIGADNQMIDTDVPVRQMLEQIVAKFGLPPFLLGLCWSTTERMAEQQTDLLTTELWYYRSILTPVIDKICREYLKREGLEQSFTVEWDSISLQDEVEEARARLINAQAKGLEAGLKGEEE